MSPLVIALHLLAVLAATLRLGIVGILHALGAHALLVTATAPSAKSFPEHAGKAC